MWAAKEVKITHSCVLLCTVTIVWTVTNVWPAPRRSKQKRRQQAQWTSEEEEMENALFFVAMCLFANQELPFGDLDVSSVYLNKGNSHGMCWKIIIHFLKSHLNSATVVSFQIKIRFYFMNFAIKNSNSLKIILSTDIYCLFIFTVCLYLLSVYLCH